MYYQLIMLASFLLAGYQDARERLVSDLYWIPGAVAAVALLALVPSLDYFILVRIALIGLIALAFTWFGLIGQADAIALTLVATDPAPYAPVPVLVATGAIALAHIGYLYLKGTARGTHTVTLDEFRSQAKWIPKALVIDGERKEVTSDVNISREKAEEHANGAAAGAPTMVEVQYGVPQVTYIAAGVAAYTVYLVLFQPSLFFAFP